jgi:hypothetical protein
VNCIKNHQTFFALTILGGSLLLLVGCGSGNGGSAAASPTGSGTISGTAVKGPVDQGTVKAYAVDNGARGAQFGTAITDSSGNFSMTIPSYSGPVMLIVSGGTYTDEAGGAVMTIAANDVLTAVIPTITSGTLLSGIQITPLTSLAQAMAAHMVSGMTTANITSANASIGNYFMVKDILYTMPMNPLVTGSGALASQDMINYGISIAAMSQYAQTIGMTHSSGIVTAMMDDVSDGVMNGKMGSTTIFLAGMGGATMMQSTAGTSALTNAMTAFMNSSMNQSGLSAGMVQSLVTRLSTTNGAI